MIALLSILLTAAPPAATQPEFASWEPERRADFAGFEKRLLGIPSADSLMRLHQMLADEPHVASTEGDLNTIDEIAAFFRGLGLDVEVHEFWAYLPLPVESSVEVVAPERVELSLRERPLSEDPSSADPSLSSGWNAYSGSGDATGEVVYANYGTKEDFERLASLGVRCEGKIVVTRYGGNYRGYKAKFAEAAGAAALIIYIDPADSGYVRGLVYPEGSYANDSCIQRGSINTLAYPGDPLTPGVEATRDAPRLDPGSIDLPRIPVQPMAWGAASEILSRMKGAPVPEGWQGGLPFAYRLEGGPDLRVRVKVEQERAVRRSCNVIGTLHGRTPEMVVIGAHHDAWGFGAADPTCGTIGVLEAARAFAEAARDPENPRRPARTLAFAAWGAEEFGIVGSTEWVESRERLLRERCVGYINLDMAVMGPDFGSSASPMLRTLVTEAAGVVPQARDPERTVLEDWLSRAGKTRASDLSFGDMGGGSDHIAFVNRVGVSSCALTGGGAKGYAYHSSYDTLPWYWKAIGTDYEPALMVTRMTIGVAGRLADAEILPLDPGRYGSDVRSHARAVSARGVALGRLSPGEDGVAVELLALDAAAAQLEHAGRAWRAALESRGRLDPAVARAINEIMVSIDRAWLGGGLPGREWFRNTHIATDEDSGYAAWGLPEIRWAIERAGEGGAGRDDLLGAIARVERTLRTIEADVRRMAGMVAENR